MHSRTREYAHAYVYARTHARTHGVALKVTPM